MLNYLTVDEKIGTNFPFRYDTEFSVKQAQWHLPGGNVSLKTLF